MAQRVIKPWPAILVDVDGPLNPDRPGVGFQRYRVRVEHERYTVWLNPEHGKWLRELAEETGAELVWATTWNAWANVHIGPRIGLPRMSVVEIDETLLPSIAASRVDEVGLSHRQALIKAGCVACWGGRRPFVWFDDLPEIGAELSRYPTVADRLVVHVPPRLGLTEEHIQKARAWLLARMPTADT